MRAWRDYKHNRGMSRWHDMLDWVGGYPFAITITPDGAPAYVASYGANTVTAINVATDRPGRPVRVGQAPDALAVTPDGARVCGRIACGL